MQIDFIGPPLVFFLWFHGPIGGARIFDARHESIVAKETYSMCLIVVVYENDDEEEEEDGMIMVMMVAMMILCRELYKHRFSSAPCDSMLICTWNKTTPL